MANICIFDAYGTLFDVMSAARMLANEKAYDKFSKYSEKVSNTWRIKQLEYTWLRNIMDDYSDFWQITKDGLDFLNMVKQTIECGGKYPVKIGKGVNYHDMQDITEKFK